MDAVFLLLRPGEHLRIAQCLEDVLKVFFSLLTFQSATQIFREQNGHELKILKSNGEQLVIFRQGNLGDIDAVKQYQT